MNDFFDPHCHIWDLSLGYHQWLKNTNSQLLGNLAPIAKNYLAQNYLADTNSRHDFTVKKFIHIEAASCQYSKQEVLWLVEQAKVTPALAGIIAGVSLIDPDLETLLRFYQKESLVLGVRQMINFQETAKSKYSAASQDYLRDKAWLKNFSLLEKYHLMFEAQVAPAQLLGLAKLAESNPHIIININHAGFPVREFMHVWQEGMVECAKQKNINIKLSGFGMFDRHWSDKTVREIVLFVIKKFGVDRCMFASNFPVDKLYANYSSIMRNHLHAVSDFSYQEQEKLFYKNAECVYGQES